MPIVNVDAKSLEWCTYLFLSQDKVGIEEWNAVVADPKTNDIHTANQNAFKLPSRLIAKVFLFRAIYRGTAFAYSRDPDFVHVSKSVDFWQGVIDNFYRKYKGLASCHMRYIKEATTTGKLTSPLDVSITIHQSKTGVEIWYSQNQTSQTGLIRVVVQMLWLWRE